MPHKRNPITAERLCGLARILRGNLQAGLEDVALWHERDISHSSVERVILPDSSLLAYYVLRKAASLVAGLRVDADRMLTNLWSSHGLVFSQPVLLALVAAGHGARRRLPHRAGAGPRGRGRTACRSARCWRRTSGSRSRRSPARRRLRPRVGPSATPAPCFDALDTVDA